MILILFLLQVFVKGMALLTENAIFSGRNNFI